MIGGPSYLAGEFNGYLGTAAAQAKRMERLAAHGCAEPADTWLRAGPIGRSRGVIEPLEDGRHVWFPDDSGDLLVVLPVRVPPETSRLDLPLDLQDKAGISDIADIVAWTARRPEVMATRYDAVAWINQEAVELARWGGDLTVYRTAWSWLTAGAPADGAVMLDRDVALGGLDLLARVQAEDAAHAAEIAQALQERRLRGLPTVSWTTQSTKTARRTAA